MITFASPTWLWALLAPPLLALLLRGEGRRRDRAAALLSLLLRIAAASALILAAARPSLRLEQTSAALVIAIDASASMPQERRAPLLERARALAAEAEVRGLPTAEVAIGARAIRGGEPETAPAEDGTDLAALLDLAAREAGPVRSPRILLLSDGGETRDPLAALDAAALAAAAGAQIFPLTPAPAPEALEILAAEAPLDAAPGEALAVQVTVRVPGEPAEGDASAEVDAIVRDGDATLVERPLTLAPGSQIVELPIEAPEADGARLLEVQIGGARREVWLRRRSTSPVVVRGVGASALAQRLRRRGIAAAASARWGPLEPGGALILSGPDLASWPEARAAELERWIRVEGGDLLLAGGPGGLSAGPDSLAPLVRALPAELPTDRDRQPAPEAVVFVVDRSRSMERARKLEMAASAVIESIERLPPEALVGVLAFSDQMEWQVELQAADDPAAIREAVLSIAAYGGTRLYPALEEGWQALEPVDALVKHVILLSDGRGFTSIEQNAPLIDAIAASEITVSTIALTEEAAVDELATLAARAGGQAHYTEGLEDLASVMVDEVLAVLRRNALRTQVTPLAVAGSPLAGGVDWSAAPPLGGRNAAEARGAASLGLRAEGESGAGPLLTSWRYGLGSATLFTSGLAGPWAWPDWPEGDRWLAGLVGQLRERPERDELRLSLEPGPGGLVVELQALDALGFPRTDAAPSAAASGAGGVREIPLTRIAPGRYLGEIGWDGPLLVTASAPPGPGLPAADARAQAAPPPPAERAGALDVALLASIAARGLGQRDPDAARLFADLPTAPVERPLWAWLAWAGLGLMLLDLGARKLPS